MKRASLIAAAAATVLSCGSSHAFASAIASPITWGAPTNVSGDTNVSTLGTLVAAFNVNGSAVTINGVAFAAFPITSLSTSASSGNYTFTESPGHLLAETTLGSTSAPFSSLSANYQSLLSTAVSSDDNNTITLSISGLTVGQTYQFEWWLNASGDLGSGPGFRTTATATNSVTLDDDTTNAQGGTGQFALGTFTASSSFQAIAFNGTDGSQAPTINAFQLRAIPEPSSVGLLGIAGTLAVATGAFRRRASAKQS